MKKIADSPKKPVAKKKGILKEPSMPKLTTISYASDGEKPIARTIGEFYNASQKERCEYADGIKLENLIRDLVKKTVLPFGDRAKNLGFDFKVMSDQFMIEKAKNDNERIINM